MAFHKINDPERLHALIDAILLIETDADLDGLLSRIIEAAARLVGARYGALGVIAGDGKTLSRFITYGIDAEERSAIGEA
ncbi:MAG: ATPase, partial [Acidimicrobiales bacterium]